LIEAAKSYFAHVEEGLGTKNLVADDVRELQRRSYELLQLKGKSYYDQIAQDTVAMIVNDLVTLGALPLSVAMHLAVGNSDWFNDRDRCLDLIVGWLNACNLARCTWGGGETPTLKGVVVPEAVVLSGSAIGIVKPKERLIAGPIQHGDAIVIIESSGIHANGLTLARKIADKLPEGYLTKLSGGRTYGETLLDPTHIYVGLVEDCLDVGVNIHYAVNVTGHGWRKLMRATQPFTYLIETLPTRLPIFDFLQKHGPVDDKEAYGNLNMGAGFALYVTEVQADEVVDVARKLGLRAFVAGHIEDGPKKVIIKPVKTEEFPDGLTFDEKSLAVR
jgi:phosphoribosylformylglycinamidine cyclo-ligase